MIGGGLEGKGGEEKNVAQSTQLSLRGDRERTETILIRKRPGVKRKGYQKDQLYGEDGDRIQVKGKKVSTGSKSERQGGKRRCSTYTRPFHGGT